MRPGAAAPLPDQGAQPSSSSEVITAAALLQGPEPPPLDCVIGFLPAGQFGLVCGADSSGKSTLALQMSVSVASGIPVAGGAIPSPARTGPVLYVGGEDDLDEMHRRLRKLLRQLPLEVAEQARAGMDRLILWPLKGRRLSLLSAGRQAGEIVPDDRNISRLSAECKGARLIIVDPLVMFHDLSESDNVHLDHLARTFIRIAQEAGDAAIIAVHHTGQDSARQAHDDHHAGRGGTGLSCAARAVWVLRRASEAELQGLAGDDHAKAAEFARVLRVLRGPKVSRGPEGDRLMLTLADTGVLRLYDPDERQRVQVSANAYATASRGGGDDCPY